MIVSIASTLVILCGQGQAPAAPALPGLTPANQLISTMLAKYHNAKSLRATIHMVQTAMNKEITFDTMVVYERPQKIYLIQKRSDDPRFSPELVSDSVSFGYTAPPNIDNKRVLWFKETTHPLKQGQINIEEMWAEIKPQISTGDNSFALQALVSRRLDLETAVSQLVTCKNKGKVQIGDRLVNDIEGAWKVSGNGQLGTYQLYITDDGDLVRQTVQLTFGVDAKWLIMHKMPPNAFPDGILTVTTWDINATVDQLVDESLFKVPG